MSLNYNTVKEASANVFFLGLTQIINYAIPILLIPYLIKTIGIGNFGKISIIQVIILYGTMIVNYSFNYTGTIEIIKGKNTDYSNLFSSIITTKITLSLLSSFLGFTVLLFFSISGFEIFLVYISTLLQLMGQAIYPEWFYHGIQKVKYGFYTVILWKITYLFILLFMITQQSNYLMVIFYDGLLCFILSLCSLFFATKYFKIKLRFSNFSIVKVQLISNWHLFSSIIMTTFYTKGNFLFLGLFSNTIEVAIYSIAERYIFMINGLLSLLNRILLPYLTLFKQNPTKDYFRFIKKTMSLVLVFGVLLCISNLLFSNIIAKHLDFTYQKELSKLIKILSFSFISVSFCTLSTSILIVESMAKEVNKINILGLMIGLFCVAPLTYFFHGQGLSLGFICNSFILVISNLLVLLKLKKSYTTDTIQL